MNKTYSTINAAFKTNINQEGTFWRIATPDTFVDLLLLRAAVVSKRGLDIELATEVVLLCLKALVNGKLGVKDFTKDYKKLNKELFEEQHTVYAEVYRILSDSLLKIEENLTSLPLSDDLNYFKTLSNLQLNNYSLEVFENVLETFLRYIKSLNT